MKVDLHLHTNHSSDSWIPPKRLAAEGKRRLLDAIAVTDHDRTSAWREVEEEAERQGLLVIRGEEISVSREKGGRKVGEILGLFMQEEVPGGRSAHEIIDDLKEQDAIIVLPHPFDWQTREVLPEEELRTLAKRVHGAEVFNPRVLDHSLNEKALRFAREFGLAQTAGSDAHITLEIGKAYTVADADDLESFRKALLKARTRGEGTYHHPLQRIFPSIAKLKSKLLGRH